MKATSTWAGELPSGSQPSNSGAQTTARRNTCRMFHCRRIKTFLMSEINSDWEAVSNQLKSNRNKQQKGNEGRAAGSRYRFGRRARVRLDAPSQERSSRACIAAIVRACDQQARE